MHQVQFAMHRYFSGKLNVFYYYQTITSTYTVVMCLVTMTKSAN